MKIVRPFIRWIKRRTWGRTRIYDSDGGLFAFKDKAGRWRWGRDVEGGEMHKIDYRDHQRLMTEIGQYEKDMVYKILQCKATAGAKEDEHDA